MAAQGSAHNPKFAGLTNYLTGRTSLSPAPAIGMLLCFRGANIGSDAALFQPRWAPPCENGKHASEKTPAALLCTAQEHLLSTSDWQLAAWSSK